MAPLLCLRWEDLRLAKSTAELNRTTTGTNGTGDGASPSLRALAKSTRGPIKKIFAEPLLA